ncbi:MAG TPA: hypothetical protein ENJ96_07595, partial [Thermodesulfatator atlanticus]|nr:hypothetical protein [Thermodesulfatator atlanticus]
MEFFLISQVEAGNSATRNEFSFCQKGAKRREEMRRIAREEIVSKVAQAVVEACRGLPPEVVKALEQALEKEPSPLGRKTLSLLLENASLARKLGLPLCQDTGIVVALVELGEEVVVDGLYEAINEGVARGYEEGYLRKS